MNANQFLKAVEQLQGWRQTAFLLALAERAFPNYALFSDAIGAKAGGKMRQLLDTGWNLFEDKATENHIPQLLAKLESLSAAALFPVAPRIDLEFNIGKTDWDFGGSGWYGGVLVLIYGG